MNTLNLDIVPLEVFTVLNELDKGYIGTPDYMGIAYFWDFEVKHTMRELSPAKRKQVHRKLLNAGLLPENGYFPTNAIFEQIINEVKL